MTVTELEATLPTTVQAGGQRSNATGVDPLGVALPILHAQLAWLTHPRELTDALIDACNKMLAVQAHACRRMLGATCADVEQPNAEDQRFADALWVDSAAADIVKEWYLAITHQIQDMLCCAPGLADSERRRAAFWSRQWLNAMAPSNFFWSNPVAISRAAQSNGLSVVRGMRNFLADLRAGTVRMTSPEDFSVGRNLATTAGKVVFRNRLLEVIHYEPTRDRVYGIPVVIVTPWINKFYVLDLEPRKSMVKFLLDHGFDVYVTSWKNPDASMRDVTFETYLFDGIDRILGVAREISGSPQVHAVGYCIGGAALTTYLAWLDRRDAAAEPAVRSAIRSLTLLATLVDYEMPGDIEVFLDEDSVDWLSRAMARKGYLDGAEMAAAFRLIRSNSLIWHYVEHGYLYGEAPPPFDVLYWNMDTTRMPAAMHTWYLHEFYLRNKLIKKDALSFAGVPIDLERIAQPLYAVSAIDDHIAPWKQTFRVNDFVSGSRRYVLSSSGHILGIVNPVVSPPKREYRVGPVERHDSADAWLARAERLPGSWWKDWIEWLEPQSGEPGEPPQVETAQYPSLADAPGTYVLEA